MASTIHQDALYLLAQMFFTLAKRAQFHTYMKEFYMGIMALQVRMRHMVNFTKARSDFINEYWD